MYPTIFPGLGRGLDFLLLSFLVSRQEKKVEARQIHSTEYHFNDDECVKRDTFSISIIYPASFPGLGRGLDFLLPSFLVSRQEKKVEARRIRPTEYHFNDDECRKRGTFSGYKDLITRKRITFLGNSFHRWNVCGAYAIRPYRVTRKRITVLRSHVGAYCIRPTGRHPEDGECTKRVNFSDYNDLTIQKRITFWKFIFDE